MTHETRILSAAGTRLPVAMSAAFAFYGAVRFPGALHFSFFSGIAMTSASLMELSLTA